MTTTAEARHTAEDFRRELARREFGSYCEYVHGRSLYPHQDVWAKEMRRGGARTAIVAPPESYKSSTVRMYIEWVIGNNPDIPILYIMNTASQAQRQVMSIADTIESNPRYRAVFPWVKPNPSRGWSREALFVRRQDESRPDPTLYGTGMDGPYQGSHVDLLILDDPTDQQDVRSDATMSQQRERLHGVLVDRLNEGGSFVAIFTRWGEADLKRDFESMGFGIIENPVEGRYPWGRLLCPELFPDERLRRIREDKGGALYALTYLCDPGAASGSKIKREWWRWFVEVPKIERGKRIHSWDLSTGKSASGDPSAFGHWGAGEDGYYLFDAGAWVLTMDELIHKMKLLYERDRPSMVLVEEAGISIPIIQYLQRSTILPIVPVKPGSRDKVSRVDGIVHLIEAGRAWLPAGQPWTEAYVDECAMFPGGAHDDQVDQTSQALEYLEKSMGPGTIVQGAGQIRRD